MARVDTEAEVVDFVREARASRRRFEIVGGGSKRALGRPMDEMEILDVSGFSGIVDYQPDELILTAAPGTKVTEIEAALAEKGQRLGFDPPDWGPLLGKDAGLATIGGVLSADASGPARLRYGAGRDHLLGIRAVNGLGEAFKAGGRVVKNVTGFDIPKLFCGAFGTLGVVTEVTLRVFPKPPLSATLAVTDIAPAEGFTLLRSVWSSALEPTGLACIPLFLAGEFVDAAVIRIEGEQAPLAEKLAMLRGLLAGRAVRDIGGGDELFGAIGNGAAFMDQDCDVWRVFVPPAEAARVISEAGAKFWYADWAGSLLWIGTAPVNEEIADRISGIAEFFGGHASLFLSDESARLLPHAFPTTTPVRAKLDAAVKAAFDPLGLFNPGRM